MLVDIDSDGMRMRVDMHHPKAAPFIGALPAGTRYLVVPWTVENALRLSHRLDTLIPTPAYAGKYGGMIEPRVYQRRTVDFVVRNRAGFILNGLGTGKTAASLWAIEWLYTNKMIRRALILAPRSTLDFVWARECEKAVPGLPFDIAYGSPKKRKDVFEQEHNIITISNHDMLRLHDPEYLAEKFDMIVVDEASVFKTWEGRGKPARYKAIEKLAAGKPRLWLMSATPTPNGPVDAWALAKLVNPDWKMTKGRWKVATMVEVRKHRWVAKPDAADMVANILQPSIRITSEEALKEMPPRTFIDRAPDLTKDQIKMRKEIVAKAVIELEDTEITADRASVLATKLLQIACGGVRDDNGNVVGVDMTPRLEDIDSVISEAEGKVIVFGNFRHTVRQISDWLNKRHGDGFSRYILGDVPQGERNEIFEAFQNGDNPQVLVAHPATASHGLTLTAATAIIWVGPPLKSEFYEQGNARAWRSGQTRPVTIVNQVSSPEEKRLMKTLRERGELQQTVLEIVKGLVGK